MHLNTELLRTNNLEIHKATATNENIAFLYSLWTNPDVMKFVGFPQGFRITEEEIKKQLQKEYPDEFNRVLLVILIDSNSIIGECKLGSVDKDNIAETDVKLMPEFQGNGFGSEIKKALVDYHFTNTKCKAVRANPNKKNIASIKMQEAVGGKRIKEGSCIFPENMRDYTKDVYYYEYQVSRSDWENKK